MVKIVKTITFILLFILCDCMVERMFVYLQNNALDQLIPEYTVEKVDSEIVIIGSSRANHHYVSSILEDSLDRSVYNCGNDGSFFYYQTCMIDAILRRYTPKMIIWDLGPYILSPTDDENQKELDRLSRLFSLYNSNEYIDSILYKRGRFEKIKLKSGMYRYNSRLISLLYKTYNRLDYLYDRGYIPLKSEGYKYPSIKDGKMMSECYSNERELLLRQTIQKCYDNDVKIVFCLSPKLDRSNYSETRSYQSIVKIARDRDVRLIDFYHHDIFMKDSTLFKDNAHLNDRGARLFTEKLSVFLLN